MFGGISASGFGLEFDGTWRFGGLALGGLGLWVWDWHPNTLKP